MTGYDIIGDVHGCADKLETLLKQLGYENRNGAYRHAERQAVFVGDLIDRGLFQLESVAIPRAMVDHGTAHMVIGNHEFNAVAFATRNADDTDWCRPHTPKNRNQHQAFVDAIEFGSTTHRSLLDWFMSLPLWLDLEQNGNRVRVVHACWHDESIQHLRSLVGPDDNLTDEIVRAGTDKQSETYHAIETVLKGPEIAMEGYTYIDKDGHERDQGRAEWWKTEATTLRDLVRIDSKWKLSDGDGNAADRLPATPLSDIAHSTPTYPADAPPVLFGHYWFNGRPKRCSPTTACVDYSAVNGGPLVAYRWSGEAELDDDKFEAV
ncbi:metallophosphoesterase [Ilumatobacter coccineus]|uniref:Putative phosphatase n=1 Tax=Ilumatobacter coccineus (strain NBRC 103263 / KCTC 29153 / YM16-304) TaxID=1313172 RepID=A0A6C7EEQ4_ILUCY|nr:metallophosphoesterase [Ilumatobacter coccineus]BAN04412.1 putative phosphatase [Ilumatobacter coccineus YM16-304]